MFDRQTLELVDVIVSLQQEIIRLKRPDIDPNSAEFGIIMGNLTLNNPPDYTQPLTAQHYLDNLEKGIAEWDRRRTNETT